MAPNVRFGRPAVAGVSTDVIREHEQSGADVHEIADAFGLNVTDVEWALAYELSAHAKSA